MLKRVLTYNNIHDSLSILVINGNENKRPQFQSTIIQHSSSDPNLSNKKSTKKLITHTSFSK